MTEQRKSDHIELAFNSLPHEKLDLGKLYYEPLLSEHPTRDQKSFHFAGGTLKTPLWVSSMTGGTQKARTINNNLARACQEFGMGMALGSCRPLLEDKRWEDFELRETLGPDVPFYTNFGVAQLEELILAKNSDKINEITKRLDATGIIIHINPLQEWAQPEGDRYSMSPLETIKQFIDQTSYPLIVKEVGQGFGPRSLEELVRLPLEAVELAGFGGTNFTILEQARLSDQDLVRKETLLKIGSIGHTIDEMIGWLNNFDFEFRCKNFIVSGGISDPVTGYVKNKNLQYSSVIGMASQFLKYAMGDYRELEIYVTELKKSLQLCDAFLKE